MPKPYDVIVAGVGGMGSSALYQLARRGRRVLGLERFDIGHGMGSSHGITRIFRLAYFEGSHYVPLLRRALELWREAGEVAGEPLFFETGALDIAAEGAGFVEGALQSCLDNDLDHQTLDREAILRRFPAFALPAGHVGLYQPQSGFVASERAILAYVGLALAAGAEIRARETMLGWERTSGGGVRVVTDQGRYEAERLVLSPGPWIGKLVPSLAAATRVKKLTLGWFAPARPAALAMGRLPVFTLSVPEGDFYGFPLWGHPGFKLGSPHYGGEDFDPDEPLREPSAAHESLMRACLAAYLPAGLGPTLGLNACLYTMTPDEHFIIDTLPGQPEVILASPCSGHGFKFASVIGEILADLALAGASRFDLAPFSLHRFQKTG